METKNCLIKGNPGYSDNFWPSQHLHYTHECLYLPNTASLNLRPRLVFGGKLTAGEDTRPISRCPLFTIMRVYLHHPWRKGKTSFPFHWQGFLCTYGKNCYSVKVTNLTLMARHPKHRVSQHTLTAKWRKSANAHIMKKIQLKKPHKISSLGPVIWSRRKQNNIRIFMWILAHAQGKIFPVMVLADFYLRQRSCNAGIVIVSSLQFNLLVPRSLLRSKWPKYLYQWIP